MTTCLPPCLARMSARGPRIGDGCTVWAKVHDIVADHSQLVGALPFLGLARFFLGGSGLRLTPALDLDG